MTSYDRLRRYAPLILAVPLAILLGVIAWYKLRQYITDQRFIRLLSRRWQESAPDQE